MRAPRVAKSSLMRAGGAVAENWPRLSDMRMLVTLLLKICHTSHKLGPRSLPLIQACIRVDNFDIAMSLQWYVLSYFLVFTRLSYKYHEHIQS